MRKYIWIILASMLVSGCSVTTQEAKGKVSQVQAVDIMKKLDNQDTMVLVIGTTTCGSCQEFDKVMSEYIQDNKVTFYALKIDEEPIEKDDQGQEVRKQYLELQKRIGKISMTPSLLFIVKGEVKAIHTGGWDKEELTTLLQEFQTLKDEKPTIGKIEYKSSDEVFQAIQNQEFMLLVIGKTSCGSCIQFGKTIHEVIKKDDITFTEVLIDKEESVMGEDEKIHLPAFEQLETIIGPVKGTPTTFRIENGVIINSLYGATSEAELRNFIAGF